MLDPRLSASWLTGLDLQYVPKRAKSLGADYNILLGTPVCWKHCGTRSRVYDVSLHRVLPDLPCTSSPPRHKHGIDH
jgi:hypothetical protein